MHLDIALSRLYWPYVMFRRIPPERQRHKGHRWYVLMHLLWWDVYVYRGCA